LTGLRNLLIFQGMLPGKLVLPRHQFFLPGRDNLARTAPIEGLVIQHVALGQAVVKGQLLATVENPLNEERAVIRAGADGIVHDLNVRAKVNAGEDVVGVIPFGAFNKRRTKPWRNSMARRTNHPGKTVDIRDSEIFSADGLCWICHRPQSGSATPVAKHASRGDRIGSLQPVVRS
jgi:hypothetical protein